MIIMIAKGMIVQKFSKYWFSIMILLFIRLRVIRINVKVINVIIKVNSRRYMLWRLIIIKELIELGFWKFKVIQDIIINN